MVTIANSSGTYVLHTGKSPLNEQPSESTTALASLEQFLVDKINGPGYQTGKAVAPDQPMDALQVSSWMQVPGILKALHSNSGAMRLTFPESTSSNENDRRTLASEQKEIRNFIASNHDKPLAEILSHLEQKIASCHLFKERPDNAQKTTAAEWLASLNLPSERGTVLKVTDVVDASGLTATDAAIKSAVRDQIINVLQAPERKYSVVITVPESSVDATLVALSKWYNTLKVPRPSIANVEVWIGPLGCGPADKITQQECAAIQRTSLEEFLKAKVKADAREENAKRASDTRDGTQQTKPIAKEKSRNTEQSDLVLSSTKRVAPEPSPEKGRQSPPSRGSAPSAERKSKR